MRYERVIYAAIIGVGGLYAAGGFHPDVYHVCREHVYPPETTAGVVVWLGVAGGGLGLFLAAGLAPPWYLASPAGLELARWIGRGAPPRWFRIEMLALAGFVLFVTTVVLDNAFLRR